MPWKIKMFESRPDDPQIGDAWYNRLLVEGPEKDWYLEHYLSPEYKRDWLGKRMPIIVDLPGGWFCIDAKASTNDNGWTVIGEPPNISVSPSINMIGCYHGWIKDGEISDDCEGRKF